MRSYTAADGTTWGVEVTLPGSSNAMIVFRHPDGRSARNDRYNWVLSHGPESRSVTGRLDRGKVMASLADADIAQLFRRSMAVDRGRVERQHPDPMKAPSANPLRARAT